MKDVVLTKNYKSVRYAIGLMTFYFYFSFVLLPLLSPLRNLQVLEPGIIRNATLPLIFIALVFSLGLSKLLRPRAFIQYVLIIMFSVGCIVGLDNILTGDSYREYFSHLFQTSSAYLLFLVGWLTFRSWSNRFWKFLIICSLISTFLSSIFTISALDRGDIGRYYTAAYGFILVAAYGVNNSSSFTFVAILGAVLSNKRAVVLSVLTLIFSRILGLTGARKGLNYRSINNTLIRRAAFLVFSVFLTCFLINWIENNPNSGISKAYNISVNRMYAVATALEAEAGFEEAASGRLEEIKTALDDLDGGAYIYGSGAGWSIQLSSGKQVQNIHFSPLSIIAVYGIPIASAFYFVILFMYINFILRRRKNLTLTEKMAPFYVAGALIHSFFAYSLFIDWAFFFFIGVIGRSLKEYAQDNRVEINE